jgi:hypothetical protein
VAGNRAVVIAHHPGLPPARLAHLDLHAADEGLRLLLREPRRLARQRLEVGAAIMPVVGQVVVEVVEEASSRPSAVFIFMGAVGIYQQLIYTNVLG